LYEFLRVVTHPRVFADPWSTSDAWRFVDGVLAAPRVQVLVETPRHAEAAAQVIAETAGLSGNLLHDAHTAVLMREHGIKRIYTRDTDFHRFQFLEVIDPLRD
jgi:predicted nucleic acid-binding protein